VRTENEGRDVDGYLGGSDKEEHDAEHPPRVREGLEQHGEALGRQRDEDHLLPPVPGRKERLIDSDSGTTRTVQHGATVPPWRTTQLGIDNKTRKVLDRSPVEDQSTNRSPHRSFSLRKSSQVLLSKGSPHRSFSLRKSSQVLLSKEVLTGPSL